MIDRENVCKACEGEGMLADDEGWQYSCSICRGDGLVYGEERQHPEILSVDQNKRLLD